MDENEQLLPTSYSNFNGRSATNRRPDSRSPSRGFRFRTASLLHPSVLLHRLAFRGGLWALLLLGVLAFSWAASGPPLSSTPSFVSPFLPRSMATTSASGTDKSDILLKSLPETGPKALDSGRRVGAAAAGTASLTRQAGSEPLVLLDPSNVAGPGTILHPQTGETTGALADTGGQSRPKVTGSGSAAGAGLGAAEFGWNDATMVAKRKVPDPVDFALEPTVSLAFLIMGSAGEGKALRRLLDAIYEPGHFYLLHLDAKAPPSEHQELEGYVEGIFGPKGKGPAGHDRRDLQGRAPSRNVFVLTPPSRVSYMGITMIDVALRGLSFLFYDLPRASGAPAGRPPWDYVINLSASDYPCVSVSVMAEALALAPRGSNFIANKHPDRPEEYWWHLKRARPITVDSALHDASPSGSVEDVNLTARSMPTQFTLFKGEAWMVLSADFVRYVLQGQDGFARHVLLYMTNVKSSPEHYFQTVACNSPQFNVTVVREHMRFIDWGNGHIQHPLPIVNAHVPLLISGHYNSGAFFARKLKHEATKDLIDYWLLGKRGSAASSDVHTDGGESRGGKRAHHESESDGSTSNTSSGSRGLRAGLVAHRAAEGVGMGVGMGVLRLADGRNVTDPGESKELMQRAVVQRLKTSLSTPGVFLTGCDWDPRVPYVGKG